MSYDIKRSVSLYSYQDEYYDKKLDLEGCLRETAKTGATGVELLAEQMIRRFPLPIETEEFRDQWFGWMKKYNLEPSCYDAFLENHIYDNRMLTLSEQINMMKRDIRLASLLGFKNLRTLVSTPMDVIEGSLEYAEQMNVKIGLEVHAPFSLNSGWADLRTDALMVTSTLRTSQLVALVSVATAVVLLVAGLQRFKGAQLMVPLQVSNLKKLDAAGTYFVVDELPASASHHEFVQATAAMNRRLEEFDLDEAEKVEDNNDNGEAIEEGNVVAEPQQPAEAPEAPAPEDEAGE